MSRASESTAVKFDGSRTTRAPAMGCAATRRDTSTALVSARLSLMKSSIGPAPNIARSGLPGGARWTIAVAAVVTLHACDEGSADEVRTAPTGVQASTTAVTASTTIESTASVVATSDEMSPAPTNTTPLPTCNTYYRPSVTVSPDSGPILSFAAPGDAEATFTDLHLTATYFNDGGYEPPGLSVRVETLPNHALLFSSLYQFGDSAVDLNAFASSGTGFTGLIYVYNPASGSEVQFSCTAG